MTDTDTRWMRAALALARRGIGNTGGNPSVGCLIIKRGRLIGRGRTGQSGRPHAEVNALADVRRRCGETAARGATAYVTLEPCAHFGRTPPCANALIEAGIARVVAPLADPDTRVSGRGFEALRAAGVDVVTGVCADEAAVLLGGYLRCRAGGLPFVTLKLATTLDGKIATGTGESQWITGPEARARVHVMRAAHDAILVGSGTVLADDPSLDVRLAGMEAASPRRVIADRELRTPVTAKALAATYIYGDGEARPAKAAALREAGARVEMLETGASPVTLLRHLRELGLHRVFCEGGGALAAALLRHDCVDRVVWFTAGFALGSEGRDAVGPLGLHGLSGAKRFRQVAVTPVGADIMSIWEKPDGER